MLQQVPVKMEGHVTAQVMVLFASKQNHTRLTMSHITRKPVFGVCDKLRLKPACSDDETS